MSKQAPSVGRMVHYVYGDEHFAAIITAVNIREQYTDLLLEALVVFPPTQTSFTTLASYDPNCSSATWHWPEFVAPIEEK